MKTTKGKGIMANNEEKDLRKFFEGTFVIKGWNARSKEILQAVREEDRKNVGSLLENLGDRIGREWVKDKSIRKIDTMMLQKWGGQLKKAKKMGSDELMDEIGRINDEVNDMLGT